MIKNATDLKIWCLQNGFQTFDSLAIDGLGITPRTISNYNASCKYPKVFIKALKGLQVENEIAKLRKEVEFYRKSGVRV